MATIIEFPSGRPKITTPESTLLNPEAEVAEFVDESVCRAVRALITRIERQHGKDLDLSQRQDVLSDALVVID